ncbi:MAG: hypothetical protein GSR84_03710 [Desulfurococcales archaeon]|nr:hypothetical protein [Desulfurococcales archaeon]
MGQRVRLPALMLILVLQAIYPLAHSAQAIVANPLDQPLRVEVNGAPYVIEPGGRLGVSPGSRVCISDEAIYTGPGSRLAFDSWLKGGEVESASKCIVVGEGEYKPLYRVEYLVQVDLGFMAEGLWAAEGGVVTYTAPREVEADGVLYRFSRWVNAVDPDNLTLVIPVYGPVKVKAVYEELVEVVIHGPGGSSREWVRPGEWSLIPVDPVVEEGDSRLVLTGVEPLGGEARLLGGYLAVKPSGRMVVWLNYTRYYRVAVESPLGERVEWAREGSLYTIKVDPVAMVGSDRRLVFQWMEVNGERVGYPSYTILVEGPVRAMVGYAEEVLVTVRSPLGEQEHWRRAGDRLVVYQPPVLPGVVYERVLAYYLVNGSAREPGSGGVLVLTVGGPTDVVPVYVERIAWRNLAAMTMVIASALIIYYVIVYTVYRQKPRSVEEPRL